MKTRRHTWLFAASSAAALLASASQASAQDRADEDIGSDPAAPAPDETGEAIVVTGSRVIREGYSAPSPTTIVGAEQIEAAAPGNIADYLNTLPALPGSATTRQGNNSISAGTTGMNRLDLRGIGTNRTLVLVSGRRFVGSTLGGDVDVNAIPNALIERIEVVTGGASAVYGSDAVAGVVNFVLDEDFTGLEGEAQYGESRYGDAEQYRFELAFGAPFADGRGHFLIAGEYARNDGVPNSLDRPWFRQWDTLINPDGPPREITRSGVIDTRVAAGGLITGGPLQGITFDPDGTPRQFDYGDFRSGVLAAGGEGEGFYSVVSLEARLKRRNLFGRVSYELTDNVAAFAEASFANTRSQTNSSRNYFRANLTILNDNAYLPEAVRDAMADAGVTSVPYGMILGIAQPNLDIDTYRAVAGLEGGFGDGWTWESYYQYGQSNLDDRIRNVTNTSRLRLALDAVFDGTGRIVCRSTLTDPDNGCVPLNSFGGASASDAALAYVNGTPWFTQTMKQHVAAASMSGEPFSTWAGPVSVAFGGEYREESVSSDSDEVGQNRGWLFGNFLPTSGSVNVKEAFAETLVPLAEGVPGAQSLYFNGAARVTDYDTSGTVVTWKAGLTWEPLTGMRLRATRSRDIRAPNLNDLYQAGLTQRQNVDDPERGGISTNINRISSGNLALEPEIADTTSIGVVFEPAFLPQLRGSVDYFSIDIADAITTLSNQQVVDRCFEGDTSICEFIRRDADNVITDLFIQPINIASLQVEGLDFDLSYRDDLDWISADGSIALRVLASHVFRYVQDNSFVSQDFAGENSGNVPSWRVNATALYRQGPVGLSLTGRFISAGTLDNDWVEGVDIDNNHVPSVLYVDLGGSYALSEQAEVYFRVDNLFDKQPPVVANELLGTNPTLYDTIGRIVRVGVRFAL